MYAPPQGMEKLKSQVNVTFWFWLMYPPPRNGKVEITGQCDILVLVDAPPPEIEIELNMNVIEQNHFKRGHQVHFTIYPPPLSSTRLSDSMPEQETGEFQFQMDMDIWTRTPFATPHQPKKNEMLIFGLRSTSDDRLGWLMDSNPICHPSPAKNMKCSFLDYVQLLMIGRTG